MPPETETVFRFAGQGVDLEFAGTEEFVEKQLERFRKFLVQSVGGPEAPPAAEAEPQPPKETLDQFCEARPIREGRGAIQDRILLFIYYLQKSQGKREVSGDDIQWCFQQRNITQPKNLHNALGILKRKIGYLQEGSKRGLYSMSPEGVSYLEGRFRTR